MSRQNNNSSTRQSSLYSRRRQQQQSQHQDPQNYEEDDFPELPESRSPSKYIGSKYYKAPMQSPSNSNTHQEDLGFKKSHRPLRLGGLPAPRGKWTPCSTPRSTATSSSTENTPRLGDVRNKCGGVIRRTPTPQPEEEQPHFPPTVVRPIDFSSEESCEASLNASRSSSVTHRSGTSTTTMTHNSLSSSAPVTVSEHTSTAPSHATTMEVSQLDSEEQYQQYHHQTLPPRPELVVAGGRRGPLASSSRSTGGTTATASSMSVTAPPTISGFKTVVEQQQVFRYDPYSLGRVYHTVELEIEVPVQEEEVLLASQQMVFHPYPAAAVVAPSLSSSTVHQQPPKAKTKRPPLAPPAPRSLQMKTAAAERVASTSPSASVLPRGIPIPPALTNLQLSELAKVHSGQLCSLTTPRTARGGPKEGTPRLNSARSGGESPSTSRSDKYALSHLDETPRSQRGATPRSAGSTPRDLPEKMDGPYRNLAGLGVTPRPGDLLALSASVVTTPSSSSMGMHTPRSDPSVVNIVSAEQQQQFREDEEDGGCENTTPFVPAGTLHCAALQGKVDFCRYPTKAFDICSSNPRLPKEKMERMFIGQLPYNVTEMQLGWLAYAFGGGVRLYHYERITKLDRSKKKQLPTGCFHFFVEPQHVDHLMVGLHKKILVDDTGVWVARDEAQDTVLKAYTESMKSDKTKRFQGRPYGSIVIQHSTSTFDPDAPQQPVVGDTVSAANTAHTTINDNNVDSRGQ